MCAPVGKTLSQTRASETWRSLQATCVFMFHRAADTPPAPWSLLPPRLTALLVSGPHRTAGWMAEELASDRGGEIHLEETRGMAEGLARLRDEAFDVLLIGHEGKRLDALEMLEAIQAGAGEDLPVIVLGEASEEQMAAPCLEAGADAYLCVNTATTRTLSWRLARAIERRRLIAENRRLEQSQQQRLRLEHDEATRLLGQQRALVGDLEGIRDREHTVGKAVETSESRDDVELSQLPDTLAAHYRELLRAYVIMGTGNMGPELAKLADRLIQIHATAQQTMRLHLATLEELVRGLGSRSARHVINRADLLILEVMLHLADGYRGQLVGRGLQDVA
jgi:DNA-binding response OmpR family regulator